MSRKLRKTGSYKRSFISKNFISLGLFKSSASEKQDVQQREIKPVL